MSFPALIIFVTEINRASSSARTLARSGYTAASARWPRASWSASGGTARRRPVSAAPWQTLSRSSSLTSSDRASTSSPCLASCSRHRRTGEIFDFGGLYLNNVRKTLDFGPPHLAALYRSNLYFLSAKSGNSSTPLPPQCGRNESMALAYNSFENVLGT